MIGLLKPGVGEENARANLATIARQLAQAYPKTNTDIVIYTEPLRERSLPGELRLAFGVFMAAGAFLLLIACANIANLLLGRTLVRDREMAVRLALGAGRWRLLRLLMAESLLIAAAGSAVGLLLGRIMRDRLVASVPIEVPFWMRFDIDVTVVTFVVVLTVMTGATFGLLPSLRAWRHDVAAALKESGNRSATVGTGRLQFLLVVAEVVIAVVLPGKQRASHPRLCPAHANRPGIQAGEPPHPAGRPAAGGVRHGPSPLRFRRAGAASHQYVARRG